MAQQPLFLVTKHIVDDSDLRELAATVLKTTVTTYPSVDYVLLSMPEHRQWTNEYERAWQALDRKYHLNEKINLADLIAAAEKRIDYPGGTERAVREVKGDIVLLYFYDRLITDKQLMSGIPSHDMKFILSSVAQELFPVLSLILPPGSETLNFIDYTPSRILKHREVIGHISKGELPTTLIYTLYDVNVGMLPQLTTGSLHELTKDLGRNNWAGFSTRYWMISDHDPCVSYLARTSCDSTTTPEIVYRDQILTTTSDACVDDMLTVFSELEAATVLL